LADPEFPAVRTLAHSVQVEGLAGDMVEAFFQTVVPCRWNCRDNEGATFFFMSIDALLNAKLSYAPSMSAKIQEIQIQENFGFTYVLVHRLKNPF
jgi:hypothetical protein